MCLNILDVVGCEDPEINKKFHTQTSLRVWVTFETFWSERKLYLIPLPVLFALSVEYEESLTVPIKITV